MTRECFYPDGIKPNSSDGDYVPCSSNDETPSACCKTGDGCSTSGLCHGSSGFMYRGACTDSTWTAPECAQQCRNASVHNYSHLYPCPDFNGSFTHTFCCDAQEDSDARVGGCCADTIYTIDFGKVLNGAGVAQTPSSSSSSSTTTTASGSSSPSPTLPQPSPSSANNNSNKALAIGAGVGVPLALLLLAGFAYLWYRERTGRRQLEQRLSTVQSSSSVMYQSERTLSMGEQVQELEHLPRQSELHEQSIVEVASRARV